VFDMRPESFELLAKRLELIANRIVLVVLAAAFIVSHRWTSVNLLRKKIALSY
jgi:hypothetical protein